MENKNNGWKEQVRDDKPDYDPNAPSLMENKIETDKNEYAEICFAQAKCETWKERLHEGSCTYKEFLKAMKR